MKAFLRPHRFRHLYPVRFYTTKTQSGHQGADVAVLHKAALTHPDVRLLVIGPIRMLRRNFELRLTVRLTRAKHLG